MPIQPAGFRNKSYNAFTLPLAVGLHNDPQLEEKIKQIYGKADRSLFIESIYGKLVEDTESQMGVWKSLYSLESSRQMVQKRLQEKKPDNISNDEYQKLLKIADDVVETEKGFRGLWTAIGDFVGEVPGGLLGARMGTARGYPIPELDTPRLSAIRDEALSEIRNVRHETGYKYFFIPTGDRAEIVKVLEEKFKNYFGRSKTFF